MLGYWNLWFFYWLDTWRRCRENACRIFWET